MKSISTGAGLAAVLLLSSAAFAQADPCPSDVNGDSLVNNGDHSAH